MVHVERSSGAKRRRRGRLLCSSWRQEQRCTAATVEPVIHRRSGALSLREELAEVSVMELRSPVASRVCVGPFFLLSLLMYMTWSCWRVLWRLLCRRTRECIVEAEVPPVPRVSFSALVSDSLGGCKAYVAADVLLCGSAPPPAGEAMGRHWCGGSDSFPVCSATRG